MNLNSLNRLVRTRMLGGVAGAEPYGSPLCRFCMAYVAWRFQCARAKSEERGACTKALYESPVRKPFT